MNGKSTRGWQGILNTKGLDECERQALSSGRISYRDMRAIAHKMPRDGQQRKHANEAGPEHPLLSTRKGKFNNRKTVVDGITFDSAWEAARYRDLMELSKLGAIQELRLQVAYPLVVNGVHIGKYVADFVYRENDGREVVEDAKGVKTRVYRIKKKLMKALYGVDILETGRAKETHGRKKSRKKTCK